MILEDFLHHYAISFSAATPEQKILPTGFVQSTEKDRLKVTLHGLVIASPYNPHKEASQIVDALFQSSISCFVVFGTGLGHVIEAALAIRADLPVFIYEPCPAWIPHAYQLNPQSIVWKNQQIQWFGPGEEQAIERAVQSSHPANLAFYAQNAWKQAWPESALAIKNSIEACRFRRQVNVNTLQRFGRLWVRNLINNRELFALEPGISLINHAFTDVPGLLIAGGPSLDIILPRLPELRQRFLIVAVDTGLRACLQAGVEPDFLCVVDPQYWNSKHLDHLDSPQSITIAEPSASPRSIRHKVGSLLFCSSLFPLGTILEQACGHKGNLGAGGSVATSAWDFLRQCGVSAIWAAGLDLSFPGSKTHYHGSYFEEALHGASHRTKPASDGAFRYLVDAHAHAIPAIGGGTVLSDQRMDMYAHWFEEQVHAHPQPATYRIKAEHRHIRGIAAQSLEQALDQAICRPIIDARLQELRQAMNNWRHQALAFNTRQNSLNAFKSMDQEICHLVDRAEEAIKICQMILQKGPLPELLNGLEAIDTAVMGSPDKRLLGFLIEDLLQAIHTRPKAESLEAAIKLSLELYEGLAGAGRFYHGLWERFLPS